jgi:hypothetical protein
MCGESPMVERNLALLLGCPRQESNLCTRFRKLDGRVTWCTAVSAQSGRSASGYASSAAACRRVRPRSAVPGRRAVDRGFDLPRLGVVASML